MLSNDKNMELVFYSGAALLEGPAWAADTQLLYCVSIEQNLIYEIDPQNGSIKSFNTFGNVGCVVTKEKEILWAAEKEGIFEYDLKKGTKTYITQLEPSNLMRYNDGILDPRGRFLVGTKGYKEEKPGEGKLYSFDGVLSSVVLDGITISNGIGFSADGTKMYFIDTPTKKVGLYDYDIQKGTANFIKYIVEIPGEGYPDGMCVDLDGMIWVAEWEGGKVCKWNPANGEKLDEILMPCRRVTSCCLGGKNMEYLFITTAKKIEKDEDFAGGLFRVKIR